jgi:hypothetical protein
VTFIIDSLPEYTPLEDQIYIAGNFTGWDPGLPEYALQKNAENKWTITLQAQPQGTVIQYKFTRGNWETVEKGPNGEEINNRIFTYGNGDTVRIIIYNWRQDGGGGTHTAADNVSVMDEDFYIPQLDRNRRIWIYLPPDYETSATAYPVLYMHDGQNLFDAATSFAGEWEVDETLNELAGQGIAVPIVVGIDNGGTDRVGEYTPWINPAYGGGVWMFASYALGIDPESAEKEVLVFPNPSTGKLIISQGFRDPILDLRIFDLKGNLVSGINIMNGNEVDVSHLRQGTYFIRFSSGSKVFSDFFIKNYNSGEPHSTIRLHCNWQRLWRLGGSITACREGLSYPGA